MMTVAIAGGSFFWVSSVQSKVQSTIDSDVSLSSSRMSVNVKVLSSEINTEDRNISLVLYNTDLTPILKGPMALVVSDSGLFDLGVINSVLDNNVYENEILELVFPFTFDLVDDKVYNIKLVFSDGLTVVTNTIAKGFTVQSCYVNGDCNDNNVCTNNSCVNNLCSYPALPNGEYAGCSGITGCSNPPCGCVNGYCINYCTEDSDCNDNNPCTVDSCFSNSCVHILLSDNQYPGCTGVTGCEGSVCACVSGVCSSTCGDSFCASWENYTSCVIDCPAVCQESSLGCSGVYFEGSIFTNDIDSCACCGDDANEYFYNGSIGVTNHFCFDSLFINEYIDQNRDICEYYGYDWINYWTQVLNSDGARLWYASDMSPDGTKIIIARNPGLIHYSTNGGNTFNVLYPDGTTNSYSWKTVTVSDDGTKIIAGATSYIPFYVSNNSGSNWTSFDPLGGLVSSWYASGMSSDGNIMYIGGGDGLYKSINGGISWSNVTSYLGNDIKSMGVSNDGSKIIILTFYNRAYYSSNGGSSWTETGPFVGSDVTWGFSAISGDGTKIIVSEYNGGLYYSSNSGSSWNEVYPVGDNNKQWNALAISNDGTKIIAGYAALYNGRLYYSSNSGTSWTQVMPIDNNDYYWKTASMNNNGTKILAAHTGSDDAGGYVYLFNSPVFEDGECCGDDGSSDNFYNGSLGATSNFCFDGSYIKNTLDSSKNLCDSYSKKWVSNVNHVFSFTDDEEGDFPNILSYFSDSPQVNTYVTDYYKGHFKVLNFNTTILQTTDEIIVVDANSNFYSGSGFLEFDLYTNISYDGEFGLIILPQAEISSNNLIRLSHVNYGTPNISLRNNASTQGYIGTYIPAYWHNYRIELNRDTNVLKVYQDNNLLTTTTYDSPHPINYIVISTEDLSPGDKVYIDNIQFNWSNNYANCCGDDTGELFGNRTHYCSAGTITPYTGAWFSDCSAGATAVNLDNSTEFNRDELLVCGCDNELLSYSTISNHKFTLGLSDWKAEVNEGNYLNVSSSNYASSPYSIYMQSSNPNLQPQVTAIAYFDYYNGPLTFNYYGHVTGLELTGLNKEGIWRSVSISSEGNYLFACSYYSSSLNMAGAAYLSTDGGITWIEKSPYIGVNKTWIAADVSNNGQKLLLGAYGDNYLYNSSDGGNTWSTFGPYIANLAFAVMSDDGQKIIAGGNSYYLYLSSDGGITWSQITPHGTSNPNGWTAASMSRDGSYILVSDYDNLYNSSDGGATWTELQPAGDLDRTWMGLGISDDKSTIVAAIYGSLSVFISTNGGNTWSSTTIPGNTQSQFRSASLNDDGTHIVIGNNYGLFESTDQGVTWSLLKTTNNVNKYFLGTISSNGSIIFSSMYEGQLYIKQDSISFSGVTVGIDDDNAIYYILFNNGVSDAGYCCPDMSTGCSNTCGVNIDHNSYIYCVDMASFTENSWSTITLNISENFMECNGLNINNTELGLSAAVFGRGNAYFDDFRIKPTTNNYYCDAGNNEGIADGVCYAGVCVNP